MKHTRILLSLFLLVTLLILVAGCAGGLEKAQDAADRLSGVVSKIENVLTDADGATSTESTPAQTEAPLSDPDRNGSYTSKEDVALYIHTYGELPPNFITKKQAQELGWSGGGLEKYAPGKCIGGDRFGNIEGLLPEKSGRKYTECDIDTLGKDDRGAKRIVFSNDGLIYYTDDHFTTFTLLYGDENK